MALVGIAVFAAILRLAYQAELAGSPFMSGLMGDSREYDAWAQRIASGDWIGTDVFYQAPLYPYFLAVVFTLAGHDLGLVRVLQGLLGAVSCLLLGMAGRRFFSDRAGLVAAALLAIYPSAIFFDGLIQKASLDILLVTLALTMIAEFGARRDWRWLAALGIVTAALVLNRENARVLFPVIAAWLWLTFRDVPRRRRASWVAVFVAAALVVLLPVGYRNYRVGGAFLLSTSQLGPNFYIGNHPQASGTYEPLLPGRGDVVFEREDATRLASEAAGRPLSPAEVSDYWLRRGLDYARAEPLQWLALFGKKVLLTLNAAELPDTESIEAYADYSRILRGLRWLTFGVVLPLAALGAWIHRRQWRDHAVLYALFAALASAVALFYVVARYRHPLVPVVLLFAAAGLGWLGGLRKPSTPGAAVGKKRGAAKRDATRAQAAAPSRSPLAPAIACACIVAVVANLPLDVARDETYLNLGVLAARNGQPAEAVRALAEAVKRDPASGEAHFRLGLAYRDAGDAASAIDALRTAIRVRPDHADSHMALGVLLRDAGSSGEALASFRAAARLAPQSAAAHTNLGLALIETGQPAEALVEHRRAASLAPQNPSSHNNLGLALQQTGDLPQSIAAYRKALTLQPEYAEAHANLAVALASTGAVAAASTHFLEAIRLQPQNVEVRLAYAQTLCGAGKPAACLEQYEAARDVASAAGRADVAAAISDAVRRVREGKR